MNDVRKLVIVLVSSIAFVLGMGQIGLGLAELGTAAAVREQYKIVQLERARAKAILKEASEEEEVGQPRLKM